MNGLTLNWKRIFAQWNIEHRIFTNSLQYLLNLCTHENPQSKHRIFLIEWCPWYVQDFPGISASKESTCNAGNPGSIPGSGREWLPTPVFLDFPWGTAGKESTCNAGDLGSIPGLGRSPGEGNSYPLQYSGLENFMDCIVHGVTKSQTQLSDFHFTLAVFSLSPINFVCHLWSGI